MMLKILDLPLMLLGRIKRIECTQVFTLVRFGIDLFRINTVLARFQFSDHRYRFTTCAVLNRRFNNKSVLLKFPVPLVMV